MSIKYPLVPPSLGVPNVLRKNASVVAAATMLLKDSVTALLFAPTVWGIFKNGKAALVADSVVAIDYAREWQISDYPIEAGGFQSYNKVQLPFDIRIVLAKGGTDSDRTAFLSTLENIAESIGLFDVITPEYTYFGANIAHFDYRRTSVNGAGLLTVSIWLREIRDDASAKFVSTKETASADQIDDGTVRAADYTPTAADTAVA